MEYGEGVRERERGTDRQTEIIWPDQWQGELIGFKLYMEGNCLVLKGMEYINKELESW